MPEPAKKEDKEEEKAQPDYYSKMKTMVQDKTRERSKSPQAVD